MSAEAKSPSEVNAIPFQIIYLLYCMMFGIMLYDVGLHPMAWSGVTILMALFGLRGFGKLSVKDVPLVLAVLYTMGVGAGLFFYIQKIGSDLVTAVVLSGLFIGGILGNVLYFLCEKQKLDYLNGQISESGLTLRRFENWFPMWLILLGNILLVGLVTPLLWGAWYKIAGAHLFRFKPMFAMNWGGFVELHAPPPDTLGLWFGYLIENVNQSLLGVATLIGLKMEKNAVIPTGLGKGMVVLFRVGILSLGLGAVKRYLDLKKTTRRLMLAMGRAGWEQEKWESEVEGDRALTDTGESYNSQRGMWQLRMRQLLQLFPAQQDWVLREVLGRGDFQLKLQGKLKRQDLKIAEGQEPAFQPKHLSDWIRSELVEVLADPTLYVDAPGARYDVLRALTKMLKADDVGELPARIRTKATLGLMQLRRGNDPVYMAQRVEECLLHLSQTARGQAVTTEDPWSVFNERRASYASHFALVRLGHPTSLVDILPGLREKGSALQIDVVRYIAELVELEDTSQAGVLKAVERLLVGRDEDNQALLLSELSAALESLQDEEYHPYRAFAARALGYYLLTVPDEALLRRGAQVLHHCGYKLAIKSVWRLVRLRSDAKSRKVLLGMLVENGLAELAGQFLRLKLVAGAADTELLAATLLGELPPTIVSRKALREAIVDVENAHDVRWRSLCSLGRLAQSGDRSFLQKLGFGQEHPRLWAANQYAMYRCGSVTSLEALLEEIEKKGSETPLYLAVKEVFGDATPAKAEAICTALAPKAKADKRLESCETLVGLRAPSALSVLARLLQNPKTPKKIRQTAAEDLGILGRSLRRDDLGLLAESITAASWAAGPLLVALESDGDRLVRIRAARALGRLGLPEIRERFEQSLLDADENALVRQVVAQAVGEMGDQSWIEFLEERYPVEKSAQVRQGMLTAFDRLGAAPSFFLEQLGESNAKVKQLALNALAHRDLNDVEKLQLMPLLQDSHRDVRAAAAESLGAQHVEEAIASLCPFTDHEHEPEKVVRRAAIKALQRLVHTDAQLEMAWPYLEKVWGEDPDHLVIRDCAAAMARLYGEAAAPVLLQAFTATKKRQPWTKSYAGIVWALGECQSQDARAVLFEQFQKQLRSEEYNFARLIALIRPGGLAGGVHALPLLLELVENNEQAYSWVSCQVIAEIGDFSAIGPMLDILERKRLDETIEPNTEAAIMISLVRLGVWEQLDDLIALLHDTSAEREVARRRALGMLPDIDMGISPMLLMQVMNPRSTPHEKLRETAVKSLGRLAGQLEQSLQVLQWQAQADPRAKIREAAQDSLDNIAHQLQRTHRKLRRGVSFDVPAKVSFQGEPLHPAWGLPQQVEPETLLIPSTLPTTDGVVAPTVRPPSTLELLVAAVHKSDRKQLANIIETAETLPLASLWQSMQTRLQQIDTFRATHDEGFLLVPGNPNGRVETWPFLLKEELITRREYAAFCEATNHPLPRGWRAERESAQSKEPVVQINWHDADAYANWKGWKLPSHNQLLMANHYPLTNLQGENATWSTSTQFEEWTTTTNPRRRKLVQTYTSGTQARQHSQRLDRGMTLGFRCIVPIDCRQEPLGRLLLQGAHRTSTLPRLLSLCAQELSIELPYEQDQWLGALQALVGEPADGNDADVAVDTTGLSEEALLAQQQAAAAARAAEEARLREVAAQKRAEEERRKREEEERRKREEAERIARRTEEFWESVGNGTWNNAIDILESEGDKLDNTLHQHRATINALFTWIHAHRDQIWLRQDPSLGGAHNGRALLLQNKPVSRSQYAEACKEYNLPLPSGWKTTAASISEPDSPATGLSLFEVKRFASLAGAEIPTIDQVKRAVANQRHGSAPEWTNTSRKRSNGLYYSLACEFNWYSGVVTHKQRSHQLYEKPETVTFRLSESFQVDESTPDILETLLAKVPNDAVAVRELSEVLGAALRQHLQSERAA